MGLMEHRLCSVGMHSDNPFAEMGNIHCTVWGCFMLQNNDVAFVFTFDVFLSLLFSCISSLTPGSKAFLCGVAGAFEHP